MERQRRDRCLGNLYEWVNRRVADSMDNEEKKSTTTPQGKSGKRRRKKPAEEKTTRAEAKPAVTEPGTARPETPEPEETAGKETAPQTLAEAPEKTPEPTPEPAGTPAEEAQEGAEQPVEETASGAKTAADDGQAPVTEPEQGPEPPACAETADAPAEEPDRAESPAEEPAAEAPEAASPQQTLAKTPEPPAAPQEETPAEAEKTEEEPLPDGLSFSEEDLSDALDKMMPPPKENGPESETKPAAEPETGEPAESEEKSEEETPAEEAGDQPADQPEPEEAEPALDEAGEKRLSDMTRTVQLSVEQIMARMEEEQAGETAPETEAEEPPATLQDHLRNGVSGMCKWLLLVVFFVLVIAGGGVAWLYRSATPDMLPNITVTFAGQTVQPAAYKWKVPVVGNLFKRTYAETFSSTPVALEEAVEQVSPDIHISPSDYRTELTVTDSEENVIYEGDAEEFASFQFDANGDYTAKLVVHIDQSSVSGAADVSGSETWLFSFSLGVRASIHLNSESVNQGGVAAIRVGSTLDGQPPKLETELETPGFYQAGVGWVCYLPIPWNQPAGDYDITVSVSGHTETLTLKVREADWEYKDYSRESQRAEPYIGESNTPAEVKNLLGETDSEIAWTNSNFVQPFLRTLKVKLAYGTTEYVGRSYSERDSNTGAGGRTATNTILSTTRGELLIAPANGTVVLAKDLGGDYGNTLVIDHGAGVKSIFYGLDELNVKTGDQLKQGQTLASCGQTTVAELRVGTVPVDPLPVWRGQCDALKYY